MCLAKRAALVMQTSCVTIQPQSAKAKRKMDPQIAGININWIPSATHCQSRTSGKRGKDSSTAKVAKAPAGANKPTG